MMFKDLLMALDVFWAGTLIIARRSEFCILINYPEICNAYGSLVHLQATKTLSIYMSWYMSMLRHHVSYIRSLHFFSTFVSHTQYYLYLICSSTLHAFSLCLPLSGKPYKMCRLKLMYNRWSSRLKVTDGGSLSYGFQNVILLIRRAGWI